MLLQLLDQGLDSERYAFRTTVPKVVFPSASFSTKCYYNSTLFSGNLYTKKTPDSAAVQTESQAGGEGGTGGPEGSGEFPDWKFAIDAAQSVGGGQGVPDCYRGADRVTSGGLGTVKSAGDFCSCGYGNYDL